MEASRSARRSGRRIALAGLLTGAEIGIARPPGAARPVRQARHRHRRRRGTARRGRGRVPGPAARRRVRPRLAARPPVAGGSSAGRSRARPPSSATTTAATAGPRRARGLAHRGPARRRPRRGARAAPCRRTCRWCSPGTRWARSRSCPSPPGAASCSAAGSSGPPCSARPAAAWCPAGRRRRWSDARGPPGPDPAEGPVRLAPVIPFPRTDARAGTPRHAVRPGRGRARTACPAPADPRCGTRLARRAAFSSRPASEQLRRRGARSRGRGPRATTSGSSATASRRRPPRRCPGTSTTCCSGRTPRRSPRSAGWRR